MRLTNIRLGWHGSCCPGRWRHLVVLEEELTDLLRRPGWQDIARGRLAAMNERISCPMRGTLARLRTARKNSIS